MDLPAVNPQDEMLHKEHRELQKKLAELIMRRDFMVGSEQSVLEALYLKEIGSLQYRALVIQIDIKALQLRRSLLQQYINRDETPDLAEIHTKMEDFYTEAEKVISSQKSHVETAKDYLSHATFLSEEETEEHRHLYQTLLKSLHPDLNPDQTEEKEELLLEVIQAYKSADLDKMRAIYLTLNPETLLDDGLSKLKTTLDEEVERLRRKVADLEEQIDALNGLFPFIHRDHLSDPEWIQAQKEEITKEIEMLKKEKEELEKIISVMEEYEARGL